MSKTNKTKAEYLRSIENKNEFVKKLSNNIAFNLKYFQSGTGAGQSFEEWEHDKLLADLNNKLKGFSEKKKQELLMDGTLEIYRSYPKDSRFNKPIALKDAEITWARLRLTGARRLIGFFVSQNMLNESNPEDAHALKDVFYIVFLDKNHDFAPYEKR